MRLSKVPQLFCIVAVVATAAAVAFTGATSAWSQQPRLSAAQGMYVERCGGCHGIQGVSAPHNVPSLRNQAGYFMCTPEGRSYLIQLPNVARVALSDDDLAVLMNFVVGEMGRAGGSETAAPFTAVEVHALRAKPLNQVSLIAYRKKIVQKLLSQCGAPESLLAYDIR